MRPEVVQALADVSKSWLGTSHRQEPVRAVVRSVRDGLTSLFGLPDGWEIVLGNGGSTAFWDIATFGLIERQSQHLVFGEFSSKFAAAAAAAPQIDAPELIESAPGTHPQPVARDEVDVYALTHNETSTGVAMTLTRPPAATASSSSTRRRPPAASAGIRPKSTCTTSLRRSASRPTAVSGSRRARRPRLARIEHIKTSGRWCPASLDLTIALENSRLDQTYNTPALATLFLLDQQIRWMNAVAASSSPRRDPTSRPSIALRLGREGVVRDARSSPTPRSGRPSSARSTSTGVDAPTVSAVLRDNGIVDTDSYRKLGRNQLRIGMFPSVDPSDVDALTQCIDWVVEHLT